MDDLISRQAAIDAMQLTDSICEQEAIDALCELPFAQPERKTGRWINGKCDQCGGQAPFWAMASTYYQSKFCPNCGAKMEVEHETD